MPVAATAGASVTDEAFLGHKAWTKEMWERIDAKIGEHFEGAIIARSPRLDGHWTVRILGDEEEWCGTGETLEEAGRLAVERFGMSLDERRRLRRLMD